MQIATEPIGSISRPPALIDAIAKLGECNAGNLLTSLIDLNNLALARFTAAERQRIELQAGSFYIALAGEPECVRVLEIIREYRKPEQNVFVGVISPIDPRIETAEEVRHRTLEASKFVPIERLGTALAIGGA